MPKQIFRKEGILVHCNCEHFWTYRGLEPKYVNCPNCRSTISLKKHRLDTQGFPAKSSPESLNPSPKEVLNPNEL